MADPSAAVVDAPAAAPAPTPAPVAAADSIAPAPAAEPVVPASEAVTSQPSESSAAPPVSEAGTPSPAEAKPAEAKSIPASLLSEAGKPAPDPAKDSAPAPDAPAEATAPIYEPFKISEDATLPAEDQKRFTDILGKHQAPQALGQELLDLYVAEMTKLESRVRQSEVELYNQQVETFTETRKSWVDEFVADPEIGGNRRDTTLRNCAAVIEQYGSDAFRQMLSFTGAGDHPEMIRFINKIGKVLGEARPVPAAKPYTPPPSKAQRRYAGTNGA